MASVKGAGSVCVSWRQRPRGAARRVAAHGGRFEEGRRAGRKAYGLPGSSARFVDGDLQEPAALRLAAQTRAQEVRLTPARWRPSPAARLSARRRAESLAAGEGRQRAG